MLIAAGALLDKYNLDDETSPYIACYDGRLEIVEALIAPGASLDKANCFG